MLPLISAIKLVLEIALLSLVGQWVLGLLTGPARERNLVYQLLQTVSKPFVKLARWCSPRIVLDRHTPLLAFLLLLLAWLAVTASKIAHCVSTGLALCR